MYLAHVDQARHKVPLQDEERPRPDLAPPQKSFANLGVEEKWEHFLAVVRTRLLLFLGINVVHAAIKSPASI